jgi:hypothetical protein
MVLHTIAASVMMKLPERHSRLQQLQRQDTQDKLMCTDMTHSAAGSQARLVSAVVIIAVKCAVYDRHADMAGEHWPALLPAGS